MAATVWKGHLTFGLVSVPIRMFAAARPETVSFNQIHRSCGSRVRQKLFCPSCDRLVERSELVRGAEVEEGRYVYIEDQDVAAATPDPARAMEILEFVRLAEVDPVYFDTSYYLVPEGTAGEKPYYLLFSSLEELGYAAIARLVKQQREHLVIVRPSSGGLMLHTLHYADEVRQVSEYGHPDRVALQDKERELGRLFVESLAAPFEPERYKDRYRENLQNLIAARAQGLDPTPVTSAPAPPALDLMAALKASLEKARQGLPERRPPAQNLDAPGAQSQVG